MMLQRILVLIFCAVLLVCFGCGSSIPPGFPDLVPLKITVTDGGSPMDKVSVGVLTTDYGISYTTGGITDSNGVVEVVTSMATYQAKGSPVGKYKVTLYKKPKLPSEKPQEEINQMTPEETTAYGNLIHKEMQKAKPVVPVQLHSVTTTPLEIEVQAGGGEFSFDISEYN